MAKTKARAPSDAELFNDVEAAELEVRAAELILNKVKAELKSAKEEYEQKLYEMRKLAAVRLNDAERPLLGDEDED